MVVGSRDYVMQGAGFSVPDSLRDNLGVAIAFFGGFVGVVNTLIVRVPLLLGRTRGDCAFWLRMSVVVLL